MIVHSIICKSYLNKVDLQSIGNDWIEWMQGND